MTELLPCPFCGGEAKMHYDANGSKWVACENRDCAIQPYLYRTKRTEAEAIAAWNTRAERTCYADGVTHRNCKYSINRGWRERKCQNVGYYIDGTRFKCSECGYNGWTKWAKDGEDRIPNYCPNCGARVRSE